MWRGGAKEGNQGRARGARIRLEQLTMPTSPKTNAEELRRHTLLSNLGINTSQLSHDILQLPDADPSDRPRRRRKGAHRPAPLSDISQARGGEDVSSWGRNWHETIILSGIEYQRQKVSSFLHIEVVSSS